MINYINSRFPNVTLMYSTPGQYLDALIASNTTWPVRYDDLFPYADQPQDYWTGYFTSRQGAKKQVRYASAFFHSASKLYSLQAINQTSSFLPNLTTALDQLNDALGVYQHHDAITGTAKQHVADDYSFKTIKGMLANSPLISELMV